MYFNLTTDLCGCRLVCRPTPCHSRPAYHPCMLRPWNDLVKELQLRLSSAAQSWRVQQSKPHAVRSRDGCTCRPCNLFCPKRSWRHTHSNEPLISRIFSQGIAACMSSDQCSIKRPTIPASGDQHARPVTPGSAGLERTINASFDVLARSDNVYHTAKQALLFRIQ